MKKRIWIIGVSALVVIVCGVLLMHSCKKSAGNFTFETAKAERDNISNTVTATGTLQAIKTVQVGTQVSGVIKKLYVDFNSYVKSGQLLAQLDETPLIANLEQSKALVDDAKADLEFQTANYKRITALFEKNLVAQSDFDQVTYNYNKAKASLDNASSVYNKNKINLSYASILSPIDGVVLNRSVDEGQTVAASFNTPTLFTIANDLTQMQVESNVDEADIGLVKNGQRVEFTVDAFPDARFAGKVTEIRLQPVVASNVVTYTVIIQAPNPDKKLMPGMTASTTIFIDERTNVLVIPGKALRFISDKDMVEAYMSSLPENERSDGKHSFSSRNRAGRDTTNPGMYQNKNNNLKTIWIKKGSIIYPAQVETGISDGSNVEIKSGLNEGDEVLLSMKMNGGSAKKSGLARSPFMPQRPGRR
jgi:HlyD family secretion protein